MVVVQQTSFFEREIERYVRCKVFALSWYFFSTNTIGRKTYEVPTPVSIALLLSGFFPFDALLKQKRAYTRLLNAYEILNAGRKSVEINIPRFTNVA